MKPRRALAIGLLLAAAALAGMLGAAWGWTLVGRHGDPLGWLPRGLEPPRVIARQWFTAPGRIVQRVTLEDSRLGRLSLIVSLPNPLPAEPLPLVFVLGGLGTGEENIAPVTAPGANAVIGYDWPIPTYLPDAATMVAQADEWRATIEAIPGQLTAAMRWVALQPWADRDRLTLLGVSLGSLAVPATARLLAAEGLAPRAQVLAYGGAPISALVAAHPELRPRPAAALFGLAAGAVLRGIEPEAHLARMGGETLILGSLTDRFIPKAAAERMAALAPDPKEVRWLPGDHIGIGPQQAETLRAAIAEARRWLERQGAINGLDPP